MLKFGLTSIVATAAWSIIIASILLRALYVRVTLTETDMLLFFLVSAVVGAVLVDPETVVMSFAAAIGASVAITYICLVLPSILGLVGAAGEALYSSAIVMIFRSIMPTPFLFILLGGFFGNFLAERLNLH